MHKLGKILLITSCLFLAGVGCIAITIGTYLNNLPSCTEVVENNSIIFPLLVEINKSSVTVTRTQLKPGQTFVVEGDGRWYSNTTLITINNGEAVFLIEYYGKDNSDFCIWRASQNELNQ